MQCVDKRTQNPFNLSHMSPFLAPNPAVMNYSPNYANHIYASNLWGRYTPGVWNAPSTGVTGVPGVA